MSKLELIESQDNIIV